MEREELLLKSIRKLIDLSVSDDEILRHLREIGIEEKEGRELINKALPKPKGLAATPVIEEIKKEKPEKQPLFDERQFFEEKPKAIDKEAEISKLWEKGILITVSQHLEEMRKLKGELDKELEQGIEKALEKEKKKMETIMESQRMLLGEKINSQLTTKSKEIEELFDLKIKEMAELNKEIRANLNELERKLIEYKEEMKEFERIKQELKKTKESLIMEIHGELLKANKQLEETIVKSKEHLDKLDARVEKTLSLETHIVEGLVADTKEKIEALEEEKRASLTKMVEQELKKLDQLRTTIDPQRIEEKLRLLDERKAELDAFKNKLQSNIMQAISEQLYQSKKTLNEELRKEIKVEEIKANIESFELFKKQFINTIEVNIKKFNKQLELLNKQLDYTTNEFEKRKELIDRKIEELTRFEKNLAKELDIKLESLTKK